jgi:CRISPR/Cas system-associated protein Csm6
MAIAAILVLAIMIPILYTSDTKNNELDSATIENYLAEESNINQYELIGEIEPESNSIVNSTKLEDETLEDILVTNPNIENLIIGN